MGGIRDGMGSFEGVGGFVGRKCRRTRRTTGAITLQGPHQVAMQSRTIRPDSAVADLKSALLYTTTPTGQQMFKVEIRTQ